MPGDFLAILETSLNIKEYYVCHVLMKDSTITGIHDKLLKFND